MTHSITSSAPLMTWKDLYTKSHAFKSGFCLPLADNQVFIAKEVLRLVPKRRLVALGLWQGKMVVAKIFFDRNAKQHLAKDIAGLQSLHKNNIPSPAIYYQGVNEDKRIHVLLLEYIAGAQNLENLWRKNSTDLLPLLKAVVLELATQHVLGVLQHDLHLKNFLLVERPPQDDDEIKKDPLRVYTLDGGQIEPLPQLLPKKVSMENMALFLAQLGVGVENLQDTLFQFYAKSRGWLLKPKDKAELAAFIRQYNVERWEKFSKKIFRNSSEFAEFKFGAYSGVYDRQYGSPEFISFLTDPESAFNHPSAIVLKAGRSSTVVKVTLDEQELVIKRYNMKNFWHRLRRCLRFSRAHNSWYLAQKLKLFGVPTAAPIAFCEEKFFGLRGKAYFVSEYISTTHAGDFLAKPMTGNEMDAMVKKIAALLKNTAKLNISHGDLKITNILINNFQQPVLIDLDGAKEHNSLATLRTTWQKELVRFLQNFNGHPTLKEKFQTEVSHH